MGNNLWNSSFFEMQEAECGIIKLRIEMKNKDTRDFLYFEYGERFDFGAWHGRTPVKLEKQQKSSF